MGFSTASLLGATMMVAVGGALSWGQSQPTTKVGQPVEKPNVLFIAVDDLNDWVGPLGGHPQAALATPHLQRFAAQAMTFANAHCSSPSCNPSRSALMTGLRASTTGIYFNDKPQHMETLLTSDRLTLPRYFNQNGYTTIGFGKLFHTGEAHQPGDWTRYTPRPRQDNPKGAPLAKSAQADFDFGPYEPEVGDDQMSDGISTRSAIDAMEQHRGNKPLFLGLGIYRPHLPWYVPQVYFDRFPLQEIVLPPVPLGGPEEDLKDLPPLGRVMALTLSNTRVDNPQRVAGMTRSGDHERVLRHGEWEKAVQAYLASIAFADQQVGRIIDALQQRREDGTFEQAMNWENTIVVIWGDHGWQLGEKTAWRKFALWETSTRTPLLIHVPGLTQAGSVTDAPVNLLDVFPTLVDLVGLPEVTQTNINGRTRLEGRSLRPLLEDPLTDWPHVSITENGAGNTAVRDRRYRYIRYSDGTEELYDHQNDPHEWSNLAGEASLQEVKQRLAEHIPHH